MPAFETFAILRENGCTTLPKSTREHLDLSGAELVGFHLHGQNASMQKLTAGDLEVAMLTPFLALMDADLAVQSMQMMPSLINDPAVLADFGTTRIDPHRPIAGKVAL